MSDKRHIEVVAALIIKDGLFFAARRGPNKSHAGCWEFPGGKIEPGETPAEALRRELYEELRMDAHPVEFVQMRTTEMPDLDIHVHLYRTLLESENFESLEHSGTAWLTMKQAENLEWTQADRAFLSDITVELQKNPSIWEALPDELESLPTRAGGKHLFRAIQRPWDARVKSRSIGHSGMMLLNTRYDCSQMRVVQQIHADDDTTRIIFELCDGARIETIHMPRFIKSPRVTLCLSTQVGCAMNCAFCATATLGFRRNLTAAEIVQQVSLSCDILGPHKTHEINLVFMGMGEALMNTANVLKAIEIMAHPDGLNIAPVRMTLSTCGVLSELPKLCDSPYRPNLAISLHATTDELRSKLMPVNRRFPLAAIHEALLKWPYRSHEKLLIEYVLLRDVNDTEDDARRLAEFARDLPHNINIIPYNETPHDQFHTPDSNGIQRFISWLQENGCFVTLRVARGVQVGGACGQLMARMQQCETGSDQNQM